MIATHLSGRLVSTPLLTGYPILIDEAVLALKKLDELLESCGHWRAAAILALKEAMLQPCTLRSWDNVLEWYLIPEVRETFQMTRMEVKEAPAHVVHHTFLERGQSEFVLKADDTPDPFVGTLCFVTYDFPWQSWEELFDWALEVVYRRLAKISRTCQLGSSVHISRFIPS